MTLPDPHTSRPPIPLVLVLLSLLALSFNVLRYACSPDSSTRKTSVCQRWVGLQLSKQHPHLYCLSTTARIARQQLKQGLQQYPISCPLPSKLPQHGQMLRFSKRACKMQLLPLPAKQRLLLGLRISINRASLQDLRALPRMTRGTARAILEYRDKHGKFKEIEDLQRVRGIGEKSLARWRPLLKIDPSPEITPQK